MDVTRPLLIGALVMTEVGLWQWRMVVAHRGNRAGVMLLGTVGAILQITAISQVVTNIGDPLSIAAYAGGVGMGVLLGLIAGDRLTPGRIGVTITTGSPDVAEGLWARGWQATVQTGHGAGGPLDILFVNIARHRESQLCDDVALLAPDASWSTVDLGKASAARNMPVRARAGFDKRLVYKAKVQGSMS
jgi:uncharacterized protein YebE (UPF0316 family)